MKIINNVDAKGGTALIILAVLIICGILLYVFAYDYVMMVYDAIVGLFTGILGG